MIYFLTFGRAAMDATKGSVYIHIGCDETYQLGLCDQCKIKTGEIGKKASIIYLVHKCAKYIFIERQETNDMGNP